MITTIGVETVVAPNMNVIKSGVLIGLATNLGHGSGKVSVGRNLSRNLKLITTTTRVVGTPHMLFSNPMMITHVNIIVNQPLLSSLTDVGYKNTNIKNSKRGYRKPFVIIIGMPNHINGHSVRPNKVPLKYLDFKKNVDVDVHVKVFNFTMKANVKTFEKYIINMFNYTLKDTTSN